MSPHLGESGRIVLASSAKGRTAVLYHSLYAASKAAVAVLDFNLAPELPLSGLRDPPHHDWLHSIGVTHIDYETDL